MWEDALIANVSMLTYVAGSLGVGGGGGICVSGISGFVSAASVVSLFSGWLVSASQPLLGFWEQEEIVSGVRSHSLSGKCPRPWASPDSKCHGCHIPPSSWGTATSRWKEKARRHNKHFNLLSVRRSVPENEWLHGVLVYKSRSDNEKT